MMSKKRTVGFSIGLAMMVVVGMGTVVGAEPTSTHSGGGHAVQTGVVRIDPGNPRIAYVTGSYTCPPGFVHLFVSVKQVADGRPDRMLKAEGSSAISSAFLERHPEAPDEITCDGTWHTGTWQITSDPTVEGYEYGFGALIPGSVYVQFCWDGEGWHAWDEQFARAA